MTDPEQIAALRTALTTILGWRERDRNNLGEVLRWIEKIASDALAAAPAQPQGGGKCAICDGAGEYETPAGRIVDCPKCAPDARREGEPS